MQVVAERAAQRAAPQLPVDKRGHVGNKGHIVLQGERHPLREDPAVTQFASRLDQEAKLQT